MFGNKKIALARIPWNSNSLAAVIFTPTPIYEEDVHGNLTFALAVCAGFITKDASTISNWDLKVDELPEMTPMPISLADELTGNGARRRLDWHFTTPQRRAELQAVYEKSGSLEDLGKFMHVWQDQYSHAGMGPVFGHILTEVDPQTGNARRPTLSEILHLMEPLRLLTTGDLKRYFERWKIFFEKTWHETDDPSKSPDKAFEMAKTSFEKLSDAAKLFRRNRKLNYDPKPVAWNAISGLVEQFCREPSFANRGKKAVEIMNIQK